jgi:uncharacterized protein YbjT (DUF2867 family)
MSASSPLIAITGATGHIGGSLAQQLLAAGRRVRAIARTPDKLAKLAAQGAEVRVGDVQDTAFLTDAFKGADAVFAMSPPSYHAADVSATFRAVANSLADALIASKAPRVVALNGLTPPADKDPIAALHHFESRLKAMSGIHVASLRPGFFMENLLPSAHGIRRAGVFASAHLPNLAAPMVATRDIAAAATKLMLSLDFTGYSNHELMGTRDYTFNDAAATLGAAIGKHDLKYVQCSYEDFYKVFERAGFSPSAAEFHVELARTFNLGQSTAPRTTANTTTTSLEQFAREEFAPFYNSLGAH